MDYSRKRKDFVDWLRSCLMGPGSQEDLLIGISPIDRYHVGVLFPIIKGEEGIDPASEDPDEDDEISGTDDNAKIGNEVAPVRKKNRYVPPSSVGFSFFIQGDHIELQTQAFAAKYIEADKKRDEKGQFLQQQQGWHRETLSPEDGEVIQLSAPRLRKTSEKRFPIFKGKAELYSLWRPYAGGWITTISFCNTSEISFDKPEQRKSAINHNSLFEARLICTIDSGDVGNYPRVDKSLLTEEEQELELQYKDRHIYAVGHGAAADWNLNTDGRVTTIFTDFMPTVEVPQVTADIPVAGDNVLKIDYLSGYNSNMTDIMDALEHFVTMYEAWVTDQQIHASSFEADDYEKDAANRIVKRMQNVVSRMRQGVLLLRENDNAMRSFKIANRAMLHQMSQYDRSKGLKKASSQYQWRPFQLAFLLMVIESVVNEDSDFRDTVDLIWFPTGGGKTEAYLGLIAFQIVWRRLNNLKSGNGTTVIMRYTLRLLTAQQYARATRLICALELIRREETDLGTEPITIGMWVGEAASPNTFDSAMKIVAQAAKSDGSPALKLVLDACPWCLATFKAPISYDSTASRFHFRCKNPACAFGQTETGTLPCNVVDEALYNTPPTLLISTVDKFARLAWDERTNAFFGKNGNRPPELIIQDELHLIAGALGSIAGLYEAAFDTVLIQRGICPKYIASTATIRMADLQVRRLYGRNVSVFPPPGLSCDDSFFARTVPTHVRPGRLYVGYLAPMLNRQRCMAPLSAALLAAPEIVFDMDQVERDDWLEAWWTQVVYHGSLKGVGNSHNAFNINVGKDFERYQEEADADHSKSLKRSHPRIAQLTSLCSVEENARTFDNLMRTRNEQSCLDAVLATNMISVGLDVARLALMVINGQPLTTAEYIQAGSRVGRSDVPGIIFINYYRDQARSLSHYENFRPYHESFYRFVESTSITPYTYQARLRALHAALVIAIRHSCADLLSNNAAIEFIPKDDCVRAVVERLKLRCKNADEERSPETIAHIDKLIGEWLSEVEHCKEGGMKLNYQHPLRDKATPFLIFNHGDKFKGLWPTLQSMRNVEDTALLRLL